MKHNNTPEITLLIVIFAWVLMVSASGIEDTRSSLLIRTSAEPISRHLSYDSVGAATADSFFLQRNTVVIEVPWDMSGAEVLDLYRLRNNPAAVESLLTAGHGSLESLIPRGTSVVVELNR